MASAIHSFPLMWQDRPEPLKSRINTTFESLSTMDKSSWGVFNGDKTYGMLTISELKCVKKVIQQAPKEQKEFYVLDIGAGNFQFIKKMAQYINEQNDIRSDITVNIIGIRGEGGIETQESIGKCKLYELTAFKVEDIFNEFVKKGFSLEKRIDFIISRWCFRHLNDPIGTFVQTYNLLRSKTGVLIIDGFFSLSKSQKTEEIFEYSIGNGAMIDLFVRTKAPFLMQKYRGECSLDRFILQRHDDSPCQLYMNYLDNVQTEGIGSRCITRFDKGIELANIEYFKWRRSKGNGLDGDKKIYQRSTSKFLYGDIRLYNWLRKNHMIDFDMRWGTTASDSDNRFKLHQAARNGSVKEMERCLEMGNDINEFDCDGYSALHLAMKEQHMECFQFLLKKGADYTTPSCDVIEIYEESVMDIAIEDLTLLWEAKKKGYSEEYIKILESQ